MEKPRSVKPVPSRPADLRRTKEAEAYQVQQEIQKCTGAIKVYYIHVGQLLKKALDEEHWIVLGYDSWWEYLRDLGLSKDAARKMIEVVEHVLTLPFVNGTETPTWTAMVRLLPLAKEGKLTEELWNQAMVLHDTDLRRELGHSIPITSGVEVQCPQCGARFQYKERRVEIQTAV